ncbi:7-deoxyloganetin glucosyltransferase [Neltuma alba]|uniref:7-deoxyloganetin glucosyltransferase n=1 Tax=Neltuma alba TaxID=207710 RepID=UPI0010A323C9|nr:7-deoxyloganetin glucosyltransferase-like [Prosopis alba]XP_028801335.1 7-deoxyloganetin glucosyltransferase-like [Prosopis alba]
MDSNGHDNNTQKLHVVCLPFPAQGHVNPFMQLAKLLHSNGLHVTFVNSEFNHKRLAKSLGPDFVKGLPDFRFMTIPDGLPPSEMDATQDIPALCDSTRKNCYSPFKELIGKLQNSSLWSPEVPPVSCIIVDANMTFAAKVAGEFGIPEIRFWTASACGMLGYLQFDELVRRGIVPFKDESFKIDGTLDTTLDWVPGIKNIQLKDLPSFIRTTSLDDIMFDFLGSITKDCMKSSSIIINTFQELESEVLEVIKANNPDIYDIGPLHSLSRHFINQEIKENGFESINGSLSLWETDSECIKWLGKWEQSSVIYVNYGSITVMTKKHLKEFAWGLAESKHPFLWIVRPDLVKSTESEETPNLPQEFLDEIKDRGYITSWCPQEQVLAHPSVGIFLTHCGWNSTLESISQGVPMICWPFFAEQQTNCWFACNTWWMGMKMKQDIEREEIANIVNDVMDGDKGKEMRKKGLEWKEKARQVTDVAGSSYKDFKRLMKERFSITIGN